MAPRDMVSEEHDGEDGDHARALAKPRTSSRAEWDRRVVSHIPSRDWCRNCVARREIERRHQRHARHEDECPLVRVDYVYLLEDATPVLVAKDNRTGVVFAFPVESKGPADPRAVAKLVEWVDARGATQVTIRSDGEPAVMEEAVAVRDARRTVAVTNSKTSAPGDHAGNKSWWKEWSEH